MPVDLHPDIVRAIREFSQTRLGRRYDRFTRREYGLPGWKVQAKTVAGEFGGRSTRSGRGVVSSAGARGPAQFIPSTRRAFIQQYGIDPWASDEQAIEGMARHHLSRGGIQGYNPGMPTYESYILNQRLNAEDRRALRGAGGLSGIDGGGFTLRQPSQTSVSLGRRTIPGVSFAAERRDARRELLLGGDLDLNRLLEYKRTVNSLADVPARTELGDLQVRQSGGQKFKVPVGADVNGPQVGAAGDIYEVFYDPLGRYYDSGGMRKGAIGGHGTHVHVAGDEQLVVRLGQLAQNMGLQVGENSHFGGATPTSGHADKSFHYSDRAIDVSGGSPALRAKFARIAMREAQRRRGGR